MFQQHRKMKTEKCISSIAFGRCSAPRLLTVVLLFLSMPTCCHKLAAMGQVKMRWSADSSQLCHKAQVASVMIDFLSRLLRL